MSSRNYFTMLQLLLAQPGIPSQVEMAEALKTDQPFVSRAIAGKLIRITPRVKRLRRYASSRRKAYLAGPAPLIAASQPAGQPEAVVRDVAIEACRDYLEAGFDPRVLRDQVALLRRAQSASAV